MTVDAGFPVDIGVLYIGVWAVSTRLQSSLNTATYVSSEFTVHSILIQSPLCQLL